MITKTPSDIKLSVFWFRRDLRLDDNLGLKHALESGLPVLPLFIFDTNILDELSVDDARITFIYDKLQEIHLELQEIGSSLFVIKGDPLTIFNELLVKHQITSIYTNKDYEPYAIQRDKEVGALLESHGIPLHLYKDQVIFEETEIQKNDGNPYTVFTPYKRKWLEKFHEKGDLDPVSVNRGRFLQTINTLPKIEALGFRRSNIKVLPYDLSRVKDYPALRDLPAENATSHLSPHLRFGTLGIRKLVSSLDHSDNMFLSELIWREFFMQILYHFPRVENQNFKSKYNGIQWNIDADNFEKWCKGETGYPMVDAGMRQLKQTGTMHNRVRMITAGFLCKHLLIDWRLGEAYFAEKLLDYELSSNNGNWQWAAGTGCDAAPYFRVFNPSIQQEKFDKNQEYIMRWVPEYGTPQYMQPIVEHSFARKRAIDRYKKGIAEYLPEA